MIFEKAIIASLQSCEPSLNYILSDRNGVEPKAPYCLVSQFPIQKIGKATRTVNSKTDEQVVEQTVSVMTRLTLHALATDVAHDTLERLWLGLSESDELTYIFYQNGLSLNSVSEITYVSTPVDTVNFKRAIVDITCLACRVETFSSNRINKVGTEGTLTDNQDIQEKINIEVEYP